MAVETELKLRISPGQLARLKRHPLLRAHQLARPVSRRLYNIYYDTPGHELQHGGMALRLRRSGRQWLQTLKGGGGVQGGLHRRNEWEMPVSGPALDFSLLQAAAGEGHLPKKIRRQLQPLFVTDFTRSSRMLSWQGAEIELCMDQGEISTEHARLPLCELELELVSGEPSQLFELALALLDIVPLELEAISKAEQGYRLLAGQREQPLKAMHLKLHKQENLGHALQALIWSVLQHAQGNLRGVMGSDDAEYLHQLRVALRRLRVLLRIAASVCEDAQLASFKKEVAVLGSVLGKIREWDVFISATLQPMAQRMPQQAGLQALLGASVQQRDTGHVSLRSAVQTRELQRLLLRLGGWMHGAYWQRHEYAGLHVRDFAGSYLSALADALQVAGEQPDTLAAAGLHGLRIQAKKLRYCAEFFVSLYGKHKSGKYLSALSEVQEVLGKLNDDAVAQRLLDELTSAPGLAVNQEAISLARGWIARDLSQQLEVLQEAMLKFQGRERLWEK